MEDSFQVRGSFISSLYLGYTIDDAVLVTTTVTAPEEGVPPPSTGPASTPFVLTASLKILPDKKDVFMKWAVDVDKAVEDVETGMLMHTCCVDPSDPLTFTWVEVCEFLCLTTRRPATGAALTPVGAIFATLSQTKTMPRSSRTWPIQALAKPWTNCPSSSIRRVVE